MNGRTSSVRFVRIPALSSYRSAPPRIRTIAREAGNRSGRALTTTIVSASMRPLRWLGAVCIALGPLAVGANAATPAAVTTSRTVPRIALSGIPSATALARAMSDLRGSADGTFKDRCAASLFGLSSGAHAAQARPVAGAGAQVVSHFALLRVQRSAADRLPAAIALRRQLRTAGAATYDPAAAVRVATLGRRSAEFLMPATVGSTHVSAACP